MSASEQVIQLEKTDPKFVEEIIEYGSKIFGREHMETITACFQCGTCSGSCPSGRRTAYRTRLVMRKALLGLKDEVLSSEELWYCTTCYTCYERCPRGVRTTDIIRVIRNIAAKSGRMKEQHKRVARLLIRFGHAVPITDEFKEIRKALGLSELPPTVHSYPEALDEVRKLIKIMKFDQMVGYQESG